MEFRILGPVEIQAGGRIVDAGQPRQRLVFAALLAEAGRLVSVEALIDRVWGEARPDGARRALHSHIARIRRCLEAAAGIGGEPPVHVIHRAGGYQVDADPDQVDRHRYRRLVDEARRPACSDRERARLLREALDLWHGPALAGLPGEWAARTRQAWGQERIDSTIAWAEALVRIGDSAAVIAPLTDLLDENPLVEPLAVALMSALHAVGRSAEALECYAAIRHRLVDELGIDPGTGLRAAQRAILRGEHISGTVRVRPRALANHRPAQLPLDVRGFTGRRAALAELDAVLAAAAGQPTAVVISAVLGTAGVGKSALAVHWAHRIAQRFPDGQLYVNLRGFDPGGSVMSPGEAVRAFLDALDVPAQRIPASLDAQTALFRSLLADRQMLVVLDNARDAEQVRPLLPGTPGCFVLVTSRNQLSSLVTVEGAHPLVLDLLSPAEARDLLANRLGSHRVAAEPDATSEIVTRCDRLPLALAIIAARAAIHPDFPLSDVADELHEARTRLDALTGPDAVSDLRAVFDWSYRTLTHEAARLFRMLGLHPGPDLSASAAASIACLPLEQVQPLLAELTSVNLIGEPVPGRYAFHDLLRAYAVEQLGRHDGAGHVHTAKQRMLDHYLHTAYTAARLLDPHRDLITLAPPLPGVVVGAPQGHEQALHWFTTEHTVLLAVVDTAAAGGHDTYAWQIAWTLTDYLDRQGHWRDWVTLGHVALAAAGRLADPEAQARLHRILSRAYTVLGRFDEAHAHYRHALDLFDRLGDSVGLAHTHLNLAVLSAREGKYVEALDDAQRALELSRAVGHRATQANALNNIGWYQSQLGQHEHALASCRQALVLHEELDNRFGQSATWDSLGFAQHHLGDHEQALDCYRHAIHLARSLGDRYGEADTLSHIGDTYQAAGNVAAARTAWQDSLAILDELDHPDAVQVRSKLTTVPQR